MPRGERTEGDHPRNRPRLTVTLLPGNLTRIRAIAEDTGRPVSRVLDDFLSAWFVHHDRVIGVLGDEAVLRAIRAQDALQTALRGELVDPDDVLALTAVLMNGEESP